MDAERLAIIGALVQQQNQNLLRLQQAIKNLSALLSKQFVQLRSQKRYAPKKNLKPPSSQRPNAQNAALSNAHVTAKPTFASTRNAGFSGASLRQRSCCPRFVRGDERWRNLVPSPYRSRNAPTKVVRWDRSFTTF